MNRIPRTSNPRRRVAARRFAAALFGFFVCSLLSTSAAAAAPWSYRYFKVKVYCTKPDTVKEIGVTALKIEKYLENLGSRPDGIRVVPATNGFHVWARKDEAGYAWKVVRANTMPSPASIKDGIERGDFLFGGFLRNRFRHSVELICPGGWDDELTFLLKRAKGKRIASRGWEYNLINTGAKGWRKTMDGFLKKQRPNNGSYIQGGLSRGKLFHLWVRKGTSSCGWSSRHQQMPQSATSLLGGAFKDQIGGRRYAPLGFNYQSPQHLWYAQSSSSSCLEN